MRFLIVPICLSFFVVSFAKFTPFDQPQYESLEANIDFVKAVSAIHNDRLAAKAKIVRIINRFNTEMDDGLKDNIANEIYEMSIKYPNLDIDLICATITHESGRSWNPRVVSHAGAIGLMQVMPRTGKWLAQYEGIEWQSAEETLSNPIENIRLGSRYLSALIETFDLEGGLAAYNGGSKRAALWVANKKADGILWAETSSYVPFVLNLYDEFKKSAL